MNLSESSERRAYLDRLNKKREAFEHNQREIFNAGQGPHSHAEISDWLKCFGCMVRRKDQLEQRHKLNLAGSKKYLNWRKKNTTEYDRRMYVANELDLQFGVKDLRTLPKNTVTII